MLDTAPTSVILSRRAFARVAGGSALFIHGRADSPAMAAAAAPIAIVKPTSIVWPSLEDSVCVTQLPSFVAAAPAPRAPPCTTRRGRRAGAFYESS